MTSYDILADAIVEPTFVASVVRTGRGLGHVEFHALLRDSLLAPPAEGEAIIGRLADAIHRAYFPGSMAATVARDLALYHARLAAEPARPAAATCGAACRIGNSC
jgi:hypothetical protein